MTCRWRCLSFNVGVEVGQLGFVALILALERSFRSSGNSLAALGTGASRIYRGLTRSVLDDAESGDFPGSDTMRNLHRPEKAVDAPQSPHAPDAFYDIAERFQSAVLRLRQGAVSDLSSTAF